MYRKKWERRYSTTLNISDKLIIHSTTRYQNIFFFFLSNIFTTYTIAFHYVRIICVKPHHLPLHYCRYVQFFMWVLKCRRNEEKCNRTEITCRDERYIFFHNDIWKEHCFICLCLLNLLINKKCQVLLIWLWASLLWHTVKRKKAMLLLGRQSPYIFLHLQKSEV